MGVFKEHMTVVMVYTEQSLLKEDGDRSFEQPVYSPF